MTNAILYSHIESPLGRLLVVGDDQSLTGLYMPRHKGWRGPDDAWQQSDATFSLVRAQLAEYFAGERQQFDLPLKPKGTPFQQQVWQELVRIPFGSTITYAELARRVGKPSASRAVGNANGRNPISIIVPCHRVIGASGKLAGYAGGIEKKKWLLAWEQSSTTAPRDDLFDITRRQRGDAGNVPRASQAASALPWGG